VFAEKLPGANLQQENQSKPRKRNLNITTEAEAQSFALSKNFDYLMKGEEVLD
jgi:hypothetical protein